MNSIRALKDFELLSSTKSLVAREREVTTQVLRHLAEIERRKLYCDVTAANGLKYGSLFDYAVKELGYSEAAAARRIQSMRLMKELPEIEPKIESGALSLSHLCQAQGFFRDLKRAKPERVISKAEKQELLKKLELKSAREAERILLEMRPDEALPRERERRVTPEHTEVRFIIDQELQAKLDEVRSLLGPKGARLGLAELMLEMARLSAQKLSETKFGKGRVAAHSDVGVEPQTYIRRKNARYIPKSVKHAVWQAAQGKCTSCGSTHNLQFDHVQPVALGGESSVENLQLLCRSCNLRRGIQSFGVQIMKRP